MGFRCGIVGLPNVGKSTLFNALTHAHVAATNYPFCTIEPNVGVVPVPDPRLYRLAALVHSGQAVPASMRFVDIAGLVEGASKGEGLGNQFLAHIREVQAIAEVVRCFENDQVAHVSGRVDPLSDIEIVNTELCLADLEIVSRALSKTRHAAKVGDKQAGARLGLLERVGTQLDAGRPVRALPLSAGERKMLAELNLLTAKPMFYIANVEEGGVRDNRWLPKVEDLARAEGTVAIPICAALEAELSGLAPEEQLQFLRDIGVPEPGLNRVIRAGYDLLGLQTFFTIPKEVRAWTVRRGATAIEAAGAIHTDFARGFIRAEVVSYDDYVDYGGEQGAKDAGKWRLEGRDYVVQDGDVMLFRFNI